MPSEKAVELTPFHDFSLISVNEKIEWEQALPKAILNSMKMSSGFSISDWKIENQLIPMLLTTRELVRQGERNPSRICDYFSVNSNDFDHY